VLNFCRSVYVGCWFIDQSFQNPHTLLVAHYVTGVYFKLGVVESSIYADRSWNGKGVWQKLCFLTHYLPYKLVVNPMPDKCKLSSEYAFCVLNLLHRHWRQSACVTFQGNCRPMSFLCWVVILQPFYFFSVCLAGWSFKVLWASLYQTIERNKHLIFSD